MEFEVAITLDDYRKASLLHTKLTPMLTYIFAAVFLVLVILGIATFERDTAISILFFMAALVFIVPRALIRHIFLPEMALRAYSEQKTLHVPYLYRASDDGLTVSSKYGESRLPWDHLMKWRADSQLLLLYHTRSHFFIIPKRAFASESEVGRLLDTLTRNGVQSA